MAEDESGSALECKAGNWVKLHRSILKWEWHDDPKTGWLFITLLAMANWRPGKWHGIPVEPGQLITGRNKLSKQTGLSERSIRTSLTKLKTTNEVTIKTTKKFSIITINNWDTYQGLIDSTDQVSDHQKANKRPSTDQQTTTILEYKKEKNTKKIKEIFNPEGKTKYLDWVYLSDEEMARVQAYYERNGLDMDDLSEAVRQLDLWFDNNRNMRPKRTSDEKALKGWPMQKAIEAKKNKTLLAKAQAPRPSIYPQKGSYGVPNELPEATRILLMQANKGKMT